MKLATILCVCALCVLALAGCAGAAGDVSPRKDTPSVEPTTETPRPAPDTARIVCEEKGTRVLTPEVRARPDGVHFEISNRLGKDTGYAVKTPDGGGMGENAPKGESRHVESLPPGEVRIGCYPSINADPDYANLKVLAKGSGYRSIALECSGGGAVTGMDGVAGDVAEIEEDPLPFVRRNLAGRLQEGDIVEAAGYPESRDERAVRVVRDGKVIFTVSYGRENGGWLENGYSACESF